MTIYDHVMTTNQCTDMSQTMTRSWHNQELTTSLSYNDHPTTITQKGHDHGVTVISWSFIGITIIMMLSHHTCNIHLIILSGPHQNHPIYMVTYMLSWSSHDDGGINVLFLCDCHDHCVIMPFPSQEYDIFNIV